MTRGEVQDSILSWSYTISGAAIRGLALALGWEWLIIPVFPDAPRISILQATGIGALLGFVFRIGAKPIDDEPKEEKDTRNSVLLLTLYEPVMFLIVAFVVKQVA